MLTADLHRATLTPIATCLTIIAAAACGGTSVTEVTGPTLARCTATVSLDVASLPADGSGRATVTIDAARECSWTARTNASWLQLSSTTGQGPATVVLTASSNPRASTRTAEIHVNDQQLGLVQEGRPCRLELRPTSIQMSYEGGRASVAVTTDEGCEWEASTTAPWVNAPTTVRTGSGSLEFEVAPNEGGSREAVILIADLEFTISQRRYDPTGGPALPPAGLGATILSDSRVELSWTNADSTAQTQVYRNGALVATKDAGVSSHQDSGLSRATNYMYLVRHVKNGTEGANSNTVVARPVFHATGGTVSNSGPYRQHLFTGSGSFVVTQGGTIDEIIIIGGGGGGGGSQEGTEYGGGGGGAGGVRVISMKGEASGTYSVVIGRGGAGGSGSRPDLANTNGATGSASSYGRDRAEGGGAGAGAASTGVPNAGGSGGSGGGGAGGAGGVGRAGEGNSGGAGVYNIGGSAGGGGGGGKGGPGANGNGGQGGNGGPGYATWYGMVASGGAGGRGTGGHGEDGDAPGDGGNGNDSYGDGGRGADGAVLIRYLR